MFCSKCGVENSDTARYCKVCGNSIDKIKTSIIDEKSVNDKNKYILMDDKARKFNTMMRNSGILNIGLSV